MSQYIRTCKIYYFVKRHAALFGTRFYHAAVVNLITLYGNIIFLSEAEVCEICTLFSEDLIYLKQKRANVKVIYDNITYELSKIQRRR